MAVSDDTETTILVDTKVRNAAKAAAALEGIGLRKWVERVLLEASETNGKRT